LNVVATEGDTTEENGDKSSVTLGTSPSTPVKGQ